MKAEGSQKTLASFFFITLTYELACFIKLFFIIRGRAPWLGPHFLNFFSAINTAWNGIFFADVGKIWLSYAQFLEKLQ